MQTVIKYTEKNEIWSYTSVTNDRYSINIAQQAIVEYVYNKTLPKSDAMRVALRNAKQWKYCVSRDIKEAAEIACLQNESTIWNEDETTEVAYVEVDDISDFWQSEYEAFLNSLRNDQVEVA